MMTIPSIAGMTQSEFAALPHVITGASKEVRYFGNGLVAIKLLPTIHSFTHDRCDVVPGSDKPRLRASRLFVQELRGLGFRHAYREVTDNFILADLVMPHPVEFKNYQTRPFVPSDLEPEQIALLPRSANLEVVAKRYLTGNTKKSCIGLAGSRVRESHPFFAGLPLEADGPLPEMLIRFDWRNPLRQPGRGERELALMLKGLEHYTLPDEVRLRIMSYLDRTADEQMAAPDWFIEKERATQTAALAAMSIEYYLAQHELVFYDICLSIDESGRLLYGELSPDCGRFRSLDGDPLDKDAWRRGDDMADVVKKWHAFCDMLESKTAKTGGAI